MTAQLATIENRNDIATRDDVSTQALVFDPDTINNMMRMADMMAKATVTVPKHLAGKPADCLAVIMQAAQFQLNPFAVAQKTHIVNGQLGYESQLVNAVVQSSGAIKGRFHYEYRGEGAKVECRVGAIPSGEHEIVWGEWLSAADVTTKNSPLWKTNPRQQLGYLQVKNWARQYAPGAILGVYSADELRDSEPMNMGAAHIIPDPDPEPTSRTESVKAKLASRKTKPAAKPGPTVNLDAVLDAIYQAADLDALKAAGEQAKPLQGADREAALAAYKARQAELKASEQAPEPEPTEADDKTAEIEASLIRAASTAADDEERAEILDAARVLSPEARDRVANAFKTNE